MQYPLGLFVGSMVHLKKLERYVSGKQRPYFKFLSISSCTLLSFPRITWKDLRCVEHLPEYRAFTCPSIPDCLIGIIILLLVCFYNCIVEIVWLEQEVAKAPSTFRKCHTYIGPSEEKYVLLVQAFYLKIGVCPNRVCIWNSEEKMCTGTSFMHPTFYKISGNLIWLLYVTN